MFSEREAIVGLDCLIGGAADADGFVGEVVKDGDVPFELTDGIGIVFVVFARIDFASFLVADVGFEPVKLTVRGLLRWLLVSLVVFGAGWLLCRSLCFTSHSLYLLLVVVDESVDVDALLAQGERLVMADPRPLQLGLASESGAGDENVGLQVGFHLASVLVRMLP